MDLPMDAPKEEFETVKLKDGTELEVRVKPKTQFDICGAVIPNRDPNDWPY